MQTKQNQLDLPTRQDVLLLAISYSINDKVEKDHFNFENAKTRSNFFRPAVDDGPASAGIPTGVLQRLIETLSFEGNWIIDATRESGKYIVQCLHNNNHIPLCITTSFCYNNVATSKINLDQYSLLCNTHAVSKFRQKGRHS